MKDKRSIKKDLIKRAKKLRKSGNLSEVLLWNKLKRNRLNNLKFNRQKIIGNYIVDFFCSSKRTIIEIDGSSHNLKYEYDKYFIKIRNLT
jgi:very-short-patch-repair endonuclease